MSDDFPTREQEEQIAKLAIEHGGVRVHTLEDDRLVRLSFHTHGKGDVWLDEDGVDVSALHRVEPNVHFEIPRLLVVELLGREPYEQALAGIPRGTTYEAISLGTELGGALIAKIRSLVGGDETALVHFVFDGPPGPEGQSFVETETPDGRGLGVGEWVELAGGHWAIECRVAAADVRGPEGA